MRNSWAGLESPPMWKLFQIAVVFCVLMSNVHYEWTPNPYLAGLIAVGCAFVATVALAWLFTLPLRLKTLLRSPRQHQEVSEITVIRGQPRPDAAAYKIRDIAHVGLGANGRAQPSQLAKPE